MIILPEHALKSQNLASYTKLKTYNDKKIYRKDINIITLESHPQSNIKYYIQLENLHKRVYSYEPRRNVVRLFFQIDKTNPKKNKKKERKERKDHLRSHQTPLLSKARAAPSKNPLEVRVENAQFEFVADFWGGTKGNWRQPAGSPGEP